MIEEKRKIKKERDREAQRSKQQKMFTELYDPAQTYNSQRRYIYSLCEICL